MNLNYLKLTLRVIFTPSCWLRVGALSHAWDRELRAQLAINKFTDFGVCTANLGGYNLWTSNYPYSCFGEYKLGSGKKEYLPTRKTVFLLKDALDEDYINSKRNKVKLRIVK